MWLMMSGGNLFICETVPSCHSGLNAWFDKLTTKGIQSGRKTVVFWMLDQVRHDVLNNDVPEVFEPTWS